MKKLAMWILVLSVTMACVACGTENETNNEVFATTSPVLEQSVVSVPTESVSNDTATAVPAQATTDPDHTPLPEYATDTPEPTAYTGVFGTTLISRNMVNGVQENTYYNETLDFSQLQLEILSFDPTSTTEALRLKITMPADWTDTVQAWMRKEGLRMRFAVDGRSVDGFRQRELTYEEGSNTFEITYKQCILDEYDLSGTTLSVTPFVEEYVWIESWEKEESTDEYVRYNLSGGSLFVFQYNSTETAKKPFRTEGEKHYLTASAVSVSMPTAQKSGSRPSNLNTVTFAIEDAERNIKEGVYTIDPYQGPTWYTYYQRVLDFSNASLSLETFHIWEDEIELAFTWNFPEEWTDLECMGVYHALRFFVYEGKNETLTSKDVSSSSDRRTLFSTRSSKSALFPMHNCAEPESSMVGHRAKTFHIWQSVLSVEDWEKVNYITIIPYYTIYQNGEESFTEEGVYLGNIERRNREKVFLYDCAITIEVTSDLFEDGF